MIVDICIYENANLLYTKQTDSTSESVENDSDNNCECKSVKV